MNDNKSKRGHALLTQKLRNQIPALYATDDKGLDAIAYAKLFCPYNGWIWYISEYDGKDTCFGLVIGFEKELGYFSLAELENTQVHNGIPAVERDLSFQPTPLRKLFDLHQKETW